MIQKQLKGSLSRGHQNNESTSKWHHNNIVSCEGGIENDRLSGRNQTNCHGGSKNNGKLSTGQQNNKTLSRGHRNNVIKRASKQ